MLYITLDFNTLVAASYLLSFPNLSVLWLCIFMGFMYGCPEDGAVPEISF